MFKVDLKNLNPGTWFTMEGGGKVCLRLCAGDDYLAIRKACVTNIAWEVDGDSRDAELGRDLA